MDEASLTLQLNCSALIESYHATTSLSGRGAVLFTHLLFYALQQCFCSEYSTYYAIPPRSGWYSVLTLPYAWAAAPSSVDQLSRFLWAPAQSQPSSYFELQDAMNLRRALYTQHGTEYGCPQDPTIMYMFKYKLPRLEPPATVFASRFWDKVENPPNIVNHHENPEDAHFSAPHLFPSPVISSFAPSHADGVPLGGGKVRPASRPPILREAMRQFYLSPPASGRSTETSFPPRSSAAGSSASFSASSLFTSSVTHHKAPARLGFLFLTQGDLMLHPDIWIDWFTEARQYSYRLYLQRKGPYHGLPEDVSFTPLYTMYTNAANQVQKRPPVKFSFSSSATSLFSNFTVTLMNHCRDYLGSSRLLQPQRHSSAFSGEKLGATDSHRSGRRDSVKLSVFERPDGSVPSNAGHSASDVLSAHRSAVEKEMSDSVLQPSVNCTWGNLNPCEYELLRRGLVDPTTLGFIFISESTVPMKPFSAIFQAFMEQPTSRFYFSNLNLPMVRKHHQWIIVSRPHAQILVDYPEKWRCAAWLKHWYRWNILLPAYAAPDEYLPFYALSERVGLRRIWSEINDRRTTHDPYRFNNTKHERGDRQFQHTWVCWWLFEESIPTEPCSRLGHFTMRLGSPVTYYWINATEAELSLLSQPHVWFARKFAKDCRVGTNRSATVSLRDWLAAKLQTNVITSEPLS